MNCFEHVGVHESYLKWISFFTKHSTLYDCMCLWSCPKLSILVWLGGIASMASPNIEVFQMKPFPLTLLNSQKLQYQGRSIFSDRVASSGHFSWGHMGWMQSNTFTPGLFLELRQAFSSYVVEITTYRILISKSGCQGQSFKARAKPFGMLIGHDISVNFA